MARDVEIRVYDFRSEQMLRANPDCRLERHYHWRTSSDWERMELNRYDGPTLESIPGRPVDFGDRRYPRSKYLIPFLENAYIGFDELLIDMLPHGYFITDYRRLKGVLRDYKDILPYIDRGHVVEDFKGQVTLVKREQGSLHGDIWVVDAFLVQHIEKCKLLKRDFAARHGRGDRRVYVLGEARLHTLSDRQRNMLDDCQAKILKEFEDAEAERKHKEEEADRLVIEPEERSRRHVITRPFPGRIEAPAFKRPPKAEPVNKDAVMGYDHGGGAITFKEVLAEGRKTPPKGLPPDLMPDAPEDCSDEQWERLMLVEQIKFRRRRGF
jgi:hypothetical protein